VEHSPQADGARQVQRPGHDEVGDLDPAQVAEAQQAERVVAEIETIAGECLDQDDRDEQRAGDDSARQQPDGLRGPRLDGRRLQGHRSLLSVGTAPVPNHPRRRGRRPVPDIRRGCGRSVSWGGALWSVRGLMGSRRPPVGNGRGVRPRKSAPVLDTLLSNAWCA
jgi:hypothetical protein